MHVSVKDLSDLLELELLGLSSGLADGTPSLNFVVISVLAICCCTTNDYTCNGLKCLLAQCFCLSEVQIQLSWILFFRMSQAGLMAELCSLMELKEFFLELMWLVMQVSSLWMLDNRFHFLDVCHQGHFHF